MEMANGGDGEWWNGEWWNGLSGGVLGVLEWVVSQHLTGTKAGILLFDLS